MQRYESLFGCVQAPEFVCGTVNVCMCKWTYEFFNYFFFYSGCSFIPRKASGRLRDVMELGRSDTSENEDKQALGVSACSLSLVSRSPSSPSSEPASPERTFGCQQAQKYLP